MLLVAGLLTLGFTGAPAVGSAAPDPPDTVELDESIPDDELLRFELDAEFRVVLRASPRIDHLQLSAVLTPSLTEALVNVSLGSVSSQLVVIEQEIAALEGALTLGTPSPTSRALIERRIGVLSTELRRIAVQVEATESTRKERAKIREAKLEALELQEASGEVPTLEALIAKNMRAEVADRIGTALPWEEMDFVETTQWTQYLAAIRQPNPEKQILVARGYRNGLMPGEPGGKPFMMASVMTGDQTSSSRRLRLLSSKRLKVRDEKRQVQLPTLLSDLLIYHSVDSTDSPFISTSEAMSTAEAFAKGKSIIVYRLDGRVATFNWTSFSPELERLLPILTFPDEVEAYGPAKEVIANLKGRRELEYRKLMTADAETQSGTEFDSAKSGAFQSLFRSVVSKSGRKRMADRIRRFNEFRRGGSCRALSEAFNSRG